MTAAAGAAPSDWARFVALGLTADLLPVVSNPAAEISDKSKMKALGKTPSRYNGDHKAVGFIAWTEHVATERNITQWSHEGDYGICLQTRNVRALDIDIADPVQSRKVRDAIEMLVGPLPTRSRSNSGKLLMAFHLVGEMSKRAFRTEHGIVEFLATGQQFVAVGNHFGAGGKPSGARYEWEGGLPDEIPYLTREEFESVWVAITGEFATNPVVTRGPGAKPTEARRPNAGADDPILSFLERTGWVQSVDSQGRAHITCPWVDEHSDGNDGSESSTTYFPAETGGFAQGHFRCLHAHCDGRTDGDFLEATGYAADGFEVVVPKPGEDALPPVLPKFTRDKRTGKIRCTVDNLALAMHRADVCGWHIAFDTFNAELMRAPFGTAEWVKFTDEDYVRLRRRLTQGGFEEIGREVIRDVARMVADDNKFDTAQVWLDGLPEWDGVPRVERYWHNYCKTNDDAYTRAVGVYTWTALAGRVLTPGVKADMVPVLVGRQGTKKTSVVEAMAPSPETFVELSLDIHDADLARSMRGKLVGELGELKGLAGKDNDAIKQWVSRKREEWTPKYKEFGTTFARRLLLIGTTNRDEILADEGAEERRWLPMRVHALGDLKGIERDRDQLWAEGAVLYKKHGVVFQQAEALAKDVHGEFRAQDLWHTSITRWLDDVDFGAPAGSTPRGERAFLISDLMLGALGTDVRQLKRMDELRVGKILRVIGFDKIQLRVPPTCGDKDGVPPMSKWQKRWYWALAKNHTVGQGLLEDDFGDMA